MLVDCDSCQATVDGIEHGSYEFEDPETYIRVRANLLSCPRCSLPLLLFQQSDFPDGPWMAGRRGYPPERSGISLSVPQPIRIAYDEARTCFRAKAYTAAALMCRKALEGISAEHGVLKGTLGVKLKELEKQGIVEGRLVEWADGLRIVGNEAAHDVKVTVSFEDARDVVEFTEALINYVFTLRDRFEEFKARKARTVAPQAAVVPVENSTD